MKVKIKKLIEILKKYDENIELLCGVDGTALEKENIHNSGSSIYIG